MPIKFQQIPRMLWNKSDPTEYDKKTNIIRFRADYDILGDPDGWIVHEKIHAYLASINFKDNYSIPLVVYPNNEVERYAYTWQFVYLLEIKRISSLTDIEEIMPWKFERYGDEWAKKYFKLAQSYARDDAPDTPPSMTLSLGSNYDFQLEDAFRKIVEEAKKEKPLQNTIIVYTY